ncbi:unnamed protein product [Rotaria magnacalcarata]|uniref:C2H2-type domain-containing protein n=1 Tax=Rotaria magnacalcarata TaxID=392030 RepID=A0A819C0W2_9BILA|nr:unnamed protein product [Rotaria magnacalcarata]CAF3944838.1 unnamed protein product [Rotaria magnacalcarata]
MHCYICKIDFNTLSAYVKHQRDLHSHSKNVRLVCSCGGSFSSLRSLQAQHEKEHEEMQQDVQLESDDIEMINPNIQEDYVSHDEQDDDMTNESTDTRYTDEGLTEEEVLKTFEKRILYLVLTLQTTFYTSEAAIQFVISNLMELLLVISTENLNAKVLAVCLDKLKSSHIRRKKAAEYFQYIEPISRSYKAITKTNETKTVKYTYVPFLQSLKNYLRLPEVQVDIHRVLPDYDPSCIQDTYDAIFSRSHPNFQKSIYLKIELNSDDLTITNPISHRSHSIFFFYWSLLNVSREKRSAQTAKRLIAACPKWARKYNSLAHTMDDFLLGINELSTTGITINVNGNDVTYFGGLFISLGDYPAQMSLNGFKESVSATHFCHLCDIQNNDLEEDIGHQFETITAAQYKERCDDLEKVQNNKQSFEYLSKKYGINCRSIFNEVYDVPRQCPYDIMHTLLEGVLPNHLNAFLDFCVTNSYFTMNEFCREVNQFPYDETELKSKPHLDLAADELKKQNNLGMPLTSMQTFHLFINLPFILKKLLNSSNFPQYQAVLICVDILSLCFAHTINSSTHDQLHQFIIKHNYQFKQLYPGKMKFKFHFMTHFPEIMRDFGPLPYTSCLATERKHQFFKGNKVRNLKNPPLMLARRHELWLCVNDHSQDGSLSHTSLQNAPHGRLDNQQPISNAQIQFVIKNFRNLPFKPRSTLKAFYTSGHTYSKNSIINVSNEHFPTCPRVGKIKWILYDGKNCAFICNMFTIKGYVQQLRAFEVQESSTIDYFLLDNICYKKPLKLVAFMDGSLYFPLHPYGKSLTII